MAGITLQQAQTDLDEARAALSAARLVQSSQISTQTGGRRIDRALLDSLIKDVQICEQRLARIQRGGGLKTWSGVPC